MKEQGKTRALKIGDRMVGRGHPTFIIAEAGLNHNGDLQIAKNLIDAAVIAKANAIKFQMRDLETFYTRKALEETRNEDLGTQYILPLIREASLSISDFKKLVVYCKEKNIIFLCTPFDKKSVDVLETLEVPAYKIASADLRDLGLLAHIALKKKPMILSTGMSTMEEIAKTVTFLRQKKAEFILLNCNSSYPSAPKDLHLPLIQTLAEKFDCLTGYSGHELGLATTFATIPLGARVIERHITLNKEMKGPDHQISLTPKEFIDLVEGIRRIEEAMQTDRKFITSGEFINRKILGKSLVSKEYIKKGEKITEAMVTAKSPGKGLSPQMLFKLVGRKALRDMAPDEYFTEKDLGKIAGSDRPRLRGKWGLIVRPHDCEKLVGNSNPPILEFHLGANDIKESVSLPNYQNTEFIVHAPELWGNQLLDLCSSDKAQVKTAIRNVNRLLEKVLGLKSHFKQTAEKVKVVVHPGGMSYGNFVTLAEREKMYEILAAAMEKIEKHEVDILIENLPPFPWYKGGQWFSNIFMDSEEIAIFCQKYGFGTCYDSSHAQLYCNYAKKDPVEFVKNIRSYIKHVHLSDAAGVDGEGLQIGEGNVPFAKLAPEIRKTNAGFTPEIWMGHQFDGQGFWMALQRLQKWF